MPVRYTYLIYPAKKLELSNKSKTGTAIIWEQNKSLLLFYFHKTQGYKQNNNYFCTFN